MSCKSHLIFSERHIYDNSQQGKTLNQTISHGILVIQEKKIKKKVLGDSSVTTAPPVFMIELGLDYHFQIFPSRGDWVSCLRALSLRNYIILFAIPLFGKMNFSKKSEITYLYFFCLCAFGQGINMNRSLGWFCLK